MNEKFFVALQKRFYKNVNTFLMKNIREKGETKKILKKEENRG